MASSTEFFASESEIPLSVEFLCGFMRELQFDSGSLNINFATLSKEDLRIPFVGREDAINFTAEIFKVCEANKLLGSPVRMDYPILACAWIPGMGKTAMLNRGIEILNRVGCRGMKVSFQVQYFNGYSLQWIDHKLPIEVSFCWRLLYMAFLAGGASRYSFSEFCNRHILPRHCRHLNLPLTIKTLRYAMETARPVILEKDQSLSIFLGIDEFQKIDPDRVKAVGKLSELCSNLHEQRFMKYGQDGSTTLYPMFAGTDWGIIKKVGMSSGLPVKRVPLRPLLPAEVDIMVEPILHDLPFQSLIAAKHLFILGSLLRTALIYSREVLKYMNSDTIAADGQLSAPSSDQLNQAFSNVFNDFSVVWERSPELLAKLLAYSFSMTAFTTDAHVEYLEEGNIRKTSLSMLSDSGHCLLRLIPGGEGHYLSLPYMTVLQFARCHEMQFTTEAEKCLLRSVKWLVKNIDENLYEKPRWEAFEDFGCAYMACRINSLVVLGMNTVSIAELWSGAICHSSIADRRVRLRPVVPIRGAEQYSPDLGETVHELNNSARKVNWVRGNAQHGFIVRNGPNGAAVDNFFCLQLADNEDQMILCAEQSKMVASPTISLTEVEALVESIHSVSPTGSPSGSNAFSGRIVASFLRNPFPKLGKFEEKKLPENSILVLRNQHQKFYGMFHMHPAASPFVDVNTCSKAQLRSMGLSMQGGGGAHVAVNILWDQTRRKRLKFESKAELLEFFRIHAITCESIDCDDLTVSEEVSSLNPKATPLKASNSRNVSSREYSTWRCRSIQSKSSIIHNNYQDRLAWRHQKPFTVPTSLRPLVPSPRRVGGRATEAFQGLLWGLKRVL